MHITGEKLKNLLLGSGVVSERVFQSAKEESLRSGQEIANVLVGRGDIPEDYLFELLAPYFGAPFVDLRKVEIPRDVLELVPESLAKSKNVVVFEHDAEGRIVKAAMTDPLDYDTIEFLRAKFNSWVEPYLTTRSSLKYGLKQYQGQAGAGFDEAINENIARSLSSTGETDLAKMAEAVPVVAILENILEHAVTLSASDIHFEPLQNEVLVRFRIDGLMTEILNLPKAVAPALVARVKILASLQIDEHSKPQDGRFRFETEAANIDIRVNVMPVFHGEKVEMRLLKSSARPLSLEELGFSREATTVVLDEIKKPHGLILVTGPTGHGKTTTLYAILHILNTPKVNITTIEDPIEYEVPRLNQTQVNVKAGITFANGLRSLLRQNPDIIMVGEIRDNETVDIAIHAALTGHLVLSSLHTNDAPSALPRLIDMGAAPFLLSSTVNLVIAQRLVRKICSSCVASSEASPEVKRLIAAQASFFAGGERVETPTRIFYGKGCQVCGHSGFHGQIGIFEVLRVSETVKQLMLRTVPVGEIRKQAVKEGMKTMFEDGLEKVERGVTTIEEVLRVVKE